MDLSKEGKMNRNYGETTMGMPAHLAGLWCYALGWISGIFFLITERITNLFVFMPFNLQLFMGLLPLSELSSGLHPLMSL